MNLYIISILLFLNSASVHEFHVSKCEVEYQQAERSVQISLQLFIDDLESALKNTGSEALFLCTKKEHPKANTFIKEYLATVLKIEIDGKDMIYEYLGKEMSDDLAAVWCYLEILDTDIHQSFSIENRVLMETFDDQKNLVKVKLSKTQKEHYLFDTEDFKGEMKL